MGTMEKENQPTTPGVGPQPFAPNQPEGSLSTPQPAQPAPSTQPLPSPQPAPSTQPLPSSQPVPPATPATPVQPQPLSQPEPPAQSLTGVATEVVDPTPAPTITPPTSPTITPPRGPTTPPTITPTTSPTTSPLLASTPPEKSIFGASQTDPNTPQTDPSTSQTTPNTPQTTPQTTAENTNKTNDKIQKIKEFFKKPTNRVLVIILGVILLAVIIIAITSATGQGNKKNNASPNQSAPAASEDTSTDTSDSDESTSNDDASTIGTQKVNCDAEKDFYSLKTAYTLTNGILGNYSITLNLDKTNPETMPEKEAAIYNSLLELGNKLNSYKGGDYKGINVTSSDTDSSLYVWLHANREKMTDEELIKNFFGPYDGLTAADIADSTTHFDNQDYGMVCEIE